MCSSKELGSKRETKEDSAASQQAHNVGYYYINSHYRNKIMMILPKNKFYKLNRKYFERWAVVRTWKELPPITFLISYLKFWLNPNFQLFFIKLKIIISYKSFAKFPALECQLTMTPQPLSVKPTVALAVSRVTSEHFKSMSQPALWRLIWWSKLSEQFPLYFWGNFSNLSRASRYDQLLA